MKKLFLFVFALIVCTSFSFAADLDSSSFDVYSFDPITTLALDDAVMPLADFSWSTSDSQNLDDIRDAFFLNVSGAKGSIVDCLRDIAYLKVLFIGGSGTYNSPQSGSLLYYAQYLPNLTYLQTIDQDTGFIRTDIENTLVPNSNAVRSVLDYNFAYATWPAILPDGSFVAEATTFRNMFGNLALSFMHDLNFGTGRSIYGRIKQLQEVLASDDDLALAESQKANREEIEDSFLNGSSGSTSLGASDFGDLSDVGGAVKDTISLNGQASIGSFTSGLAGADESGQGWFSAETRDSLDSVSSSVTYSQRDDPYNMAGWTERYAWVEGN